MIQKIVHRLVVTTFVAFISSLSLLAQHKVEMFPFGDMDQWVCLLYTSDAADE